MPVTILFGSVLESDLAAMALGLPPEQVAMLDMKALRRQLKPAAKAAAAPAPAPAAAPEAAPGRAGSGPGRAEEAAADPPEAGARAAKAADNGPETLRVRVDLLTGLMNQAGELVLSRNQLLRALDGHSREHPGAGRHPAEHQPGDLGAAGGHHADPDAAHRHGVQPVPADHPGHGPAAGQADRDRDQGRRGGAGQVHRRAAHRPAHPHHPQLRRPRHRDAGRARQGQEEPRRPAAAARLPPGRPGDHRHHRRRPRHRSRRRCWPRPWPRASSRRPRPRR